MMAQVMLLEAVAQQSTRSGAQKGAGAGLFALSLENAAACLDDAGLLQALLNLPAGFRPTAEEAAVALENVKALGAPAGLVAALKALTAQDGEAQATEDKRVARPFGELVAMLMPLVSRIRDAAAGTTGEGAAVAGEPAVPAAPPAGGESGGAQAPVSAQAGVPAQTAAATAPAVDAASLSDGTMASAEGMPREAASARQAQPAEPAAPAASDGARTAAMPRPLEAVVAVGEAAAQSADEPEASVARVQEGAEAAEPPRTQGGTAVTASADASGETDASAAGPETAAVSTPPAAVVEEVATAKAGEASLEDVKSVESAASDRSMPEVRHAEAQERVSRADQERLISRIAQAVTQAQHGERSTVRLRLYPPELGTVRVEVSSVRGSVTVRIETSTPEAQGALNANLAGLRAQLADSGVDARGIEVQYRNPALAFGHARDEAGRGNGYWQARRETPRRSNDREDEPAPAASGTAAASAGTLDILL
jgi:flagellar hook-length control protein FliK